MGLRQPMWTAFGTASALFAALVATRFLNIGNERMRWAVIAVANVAGMVATSRFAGAFVAVPTLAFGLAVGFLLFPRRVPLAVGLATAFGSIFVPFGLEAVGVLPASYEITLDRLCIPAQMVSFPPALTVLYLCSVTALPIAAACIYLARVRDRLDTAESRLRVQAWQLRQIVPEE